MRFIQQLIAIFVILSIIAVIIVYIVILATVGGPTDIMQQVKDKAASDAQLYLK